MNYTNKIENIEELKKELIAVRPSGRTAIKRLNQQYRIYFAYTNNCLENGNLSKTETASIIENNLSSTKEELEIQALSNVYDLIYDLKNKNNILEEDILKIHEVSYKNTDKEIAGKYRSENILITQTGYKPPKFKQIPDLMYEYIKLMPKLEKALHPVEYTAWLHINFLNIYPFTKGNEQCARFICNCALLKFEYPLLIIPPSLKSDYLKTLQTAQNEKEPEMFISFISEMVLESMRDYIRFTKNLLTKSGR